MDRNRTVRRSLPPGRSAAVETGALVVGLVALEYALVASGLRVLPFLALQLLLYLGTAGLVTRSLRTRRGPGWVRRSVRIGLPFAGVGVMAGIVAVPALRGPLLVALLAAVGWVVASLSEGAPDPYGTVAVTVVGLAVLFGAASPMNVGSSLMGTPPGFPVAVAVLPAADVFVFGVQSPTLLFSRPPGYHAELYLGPAAVGAMGYLAARWATLSGQRPSAADAHTSAKPDERHA